MPNVLITGVTGFLGPYIAREMLAKGYQVWGISRRIPTKTIERVTYLQGSVEDLDFVREAVKGIDIVIHSAAKSTTWGPYQEFYSVNVIGTENIIKACEEAKVARLVHVSSPSIYAKMQDQFQVAEDAPLGKPLNHYIATKALAEKIVVSSQLPYNIIRPRALVGVGDTSIVPRLFQAEQKLGIPLFHNGSNQISVTCVENVAYAIGLMCESDVTGEIFNITDGEDWTFKSLLDTFYEDKSYRRLKAGGWLKPISYVSEWLANMSGKEPLLTPYVYSTLAFSQTLDISKAKRLLGYAPEKNLKDRIGVYRDYYFKN